MEGREKQPITIVRREGQAQVLNPLLNEAVRSICVWFVIETALFWFLIRPSARSLCVHPLFLILLQRILNQSRYEPCKVKMKI